jgi:hypothetical protein
LITFPSAFTDVSFKLLFDFEDGGEILSRKFSLSPDYTITNWNNVLNVVTAVRTSTLTKFAINVCIRIDTFQHKFADVNLAYILLRNFYMFGLVTNCFAISRY